MSQSPRQPGTNGLGDPTRVSRGDSRQHVSMLLVMFVLLTMVGCSSVNEEFANEPVLPTVESDEPGGAGPGALLSGELVVVDRCLYLVDEFGVRWLPVFEAGTVSWERDTLVLRGQRFKIGERVSVGGGEASDISNLRFLQEPHDSCDVRNVWLNIQ